MKKIVFMLFLLISAMTTEKAQTMENTRQKGTKVNLVVGSTALTATLNDSVSARDLISRLPYTVKVNRAAVDYCGRLPEPLESESSEAQHGWKNGDISYIPGADWIAFFLGGEAESGSDSNSHHIIGQVDDLAALRGWPHGSIEIRIEPVK